MIDRPPPAVAEAGLRALKTVAAADGKLAGLERELIAAVQRFILHTDLDVDALAPITPEELAAAVPEGPFRERIVHACIFMTLIDGDAAPGELGVVDGFAAALGVKDASLADLHHYVSGRLKLLRFDLLRRFIIKDRMQKELREEGLPRLFQLALTALRGKDDALAARYRSLEKLPRGTLGREYFEFIRKNGFALPGEVGGAPEVIVFHDCNHVLGEYGTSEEEEAQIAAFHAGYRGEDKFALMLFVLMQFQLGVTITPVTEGKRGFVKPDLILAAFERGSRVNRDLMATWDPRDDFERPVESLRQEFGITPRIPV